MHTLRRLPWWVGVIAAGCATVPIPLHAPIPAPSAPTAPEYSAIQRIVLDAGHGGRDPGTAHFGLQEKNLNLDIVRRLQARLQAQGIDVVLTRESDEFIPLSRRPDVATRTQADLFVSIHVNANRNPQVSGVEVYYPRESVLGVSAALPPQIDSSEVALPTTTLRQILWDLIFSRSRHQSIRMATQICRSMRSRLGVRCRGVHGARFVVLREARVPAVLVEVGYVTNRAEAARLGTPSYRQAIAESIAEGLLEYARELGLRRT